MGIDASEKRARSTDEKRKQRELSQMELVQRKNAVDGSSAEYVTNDNGVTTIRFAINASVDITEAAGPDGPVFTSPFVLAPQDELLTALEYTGRNLMTTVIKNEYLRQNPTAHARGRSKQREEELAAIAQERDEYVRQLQAVREELEALKRQAAKKAA